MKKMTALLLALLMVMSLAACASGQKGTSTEGETTDATETADTTTPNDVWEMPAAGVTMQIPDMLKNLKGTAVPSDGGEIEYGENVVYCEMDYFTMPRETYDELMAKSEITDEDKNMYWDAYHEVFYVFGIKNGGSEELIEYLTDYEIPTDSLEEIGAAGEYRFFYDAVSADADSEALGEYAEEYAAVMGGKDTYIAGMTFAEPVSQYTVADEGTVVDFDTTDLDGNPVSMSDIFAQHDVTMINIWATWCGPCVNEMPELADLNRELADKNCAVVGILSDETDEATLADAKEILENAGADFTVVIAPENLDEIAPFQAYPTSYFIDSEGKIIGNPVIGANPDAYSVRIDEALSAVNGN